MRGPSVISVVIHGLFFWPRKSAIKKLVKFAVISAEPCMLKYLFVFAEIVEEAFALSSWTVFGAAENSVGSRVGTRVALRVIKDPRVFEPAGLKRVQNGPNTRKKSIENNVVRLF